LLDRRLLVILILLLACSGRPHTAATAGTPIPPALVRVAEGGEEIYDAVKAGRWAAAVDGVGAAERATRALPAHLQTRSAELTSTLTALRRAITTKARIVALHEANELTRLTGEMASAYESSIPADVGRLDYYGRALEIWSAAGETARLGDVTRQIERTWRRLRPLVQARGGTAHMATIDRLLAELQAARGAPSYARAAGRLLDAVDSLETLFRP
jgi:hypothetical protein